jgi:hypothetical protein
VRVLTCGAACTPILVYLRVSSIQQRTTQRTPHLDGHSRLCVDETTPLVARRATLREHARRCHTHTTTTLRSITRERQTHARHTSRASHHILSVSTAASQQRVRTAAAHSRAVAWYVSGSIMRSTAYTAQQQRLHVTSIAVARPGGPAAPSDSRADAMMRVNTQHIVTSTSPPLNNRPKTHVQPVRVSRPRRPSSARTAPAATRAKPRALPANAGLTCQESHVTHNMHKITSANEHIG